MLMCPAGRGHHSNTGVASQIQAEKTSVAQRCLLLQVVLPVTLPGRPSMGVSLIGMPRTDLQLLEAAAGLEKLLQQTLEAVLEKRQQVAARTEKLPAPATSSKPSPSTHGTSIV